MHLFYETCKAYERTAALKAALELKVFGAIGRATRSSQEIASATGSDPRGIRILCDFLTIIGFLEKPENGYRLTEETATFLDPASPMFVGGAAEFMLADSITQPFATLAQSVRQGGTSYSAEGTVSPENPVWVKFARGMAPIMALPASQIAVLVAPPQRLLDIAASHGMFGLHIAQRHPQARVTALDWAAVLEVARENAERGGVLDRYEFLAGDAFTTDLGGPYDLALVTNFLHHFDRATCVSFLQRVRKSMSKGGQIVTLEMIPNEDRISPPQASFSLVMLATTARGDAYTFAELQSMLDEAGFGKHELHRLQPVGDVVLSVAV